MDRLAREAAEKLCCVGEHLTRGYGVRKEIGGPIAEGQALPREAWRAVARGCPPWGKRNEEHTAHAHPRMTRTRWVVPSSANGIGARVSASTAPSSSTRVAPRVTPCGFSTAMCNRRRTAGAVARSAPLSPRESRADSGHGAGLGSSANLHSAWRCQRKQHLQLF